MVVRMLQRHAPLRDPAEMHVSREDEQIMPKFKQYTEEFPILAIVRKIVIADSPEIGFAARGGRKQWLTKHEDSRCVEFTNPSHHAFKVARVHELLFTSRAMLNAVFATARRLLD